MKKMLLVIMVCFASATATFAFNPAEYTALYKLNNKTEFANLVGYIDADQEQVNFLQHVFKITATELKLAVEKENEIAADNIVNYNLRNTKLILSEEQYKKYLVFVNYYLVDNNFAMLSENK